MDRTISVVSVLFVVLSGCASSSQVQRNYIPVVAENLDVQRPVTNIETEKKSWTLNELIAVALANEERGWNLDKARLDGTISASTQLRNPELRLGASAIEPNSRDDEKYDLDFKVRYKPIHPASMYYRHQEATWDKEESQAEIELEKRNLIYNIKKLFLKIKFAQKRKSRFSASEEGSTSASDNSIDLAAIEQQNKQFQTSLKIEQLKAELRLLVGISSHNKFELEMPQITPGIWVPNFSVDSFVQYITRTHPEVWLFESREKSKEARLEQAHIEQFPWVSFIDVEKRYEEDKGWDRPWSFQFGFNIPVFSFNLGKVSELEAEFEKTKWKKNRSLEKLVFEAQTHFEMYVLRARQMEKIKNAIANFSEKTLSAEQDKKNQNKALELLDEVEEEMWLAKINLERMLGHEVEKLNSLLTMESP